tara:strand:+ start:107 stop:346 length:240 start_codon:yes stop_codon:yes gene_type:complete
MNNDIYSKYDKLMVKYNDVSALNFKYRNKILELNQKIEELSENTNTNKKNNKRVEIINGISSQWKGEHTQFVDLSFKKL